MISFADYFDRIPNISRLSRGINEHCANNALLCAFRDNLVNETTGGKYFFPFLCKLSETWENKK